MTQSLYSFRVERERDWVQLDALVTLVERGGVRRLSDDDLLTLPALYRATLSALSVARETSLDRALTLYLEALSARAYFVIYGVRTSPTSRLRSFFLDAWPRAVRALWGETLVAAALLFGGALTGYLLVAHDPSWYAALIPPEMAGGRTPASSTASLRATLYDTSGHNWLGAFAAFLFTNNARVAIMAFALGFAFGVPTALLLVSTGAMGGALVALFVGHGLGVALGGWLLIHGTTELFAVIVAGAAGFHIGKALVLPGRSARIAAAAIAGRTAATAMAGVVVMLAVAGLLEGIGRQVIHGEAARYAIAAAALVGWLGYFYGTGRWSNLKQSDAR